MKIGTLVKIMYGWDSGRVGVVVGFHPGKAWNDQKCSVLLDTGVGMYPLAELRVI